nr:MAG TPA: hypothetical protein [Caudoviricetes sp.]
MWISPQVRASIRWVKALTRRPSAGFCGRSAASA